MRLAGIVSDYVVLMVARVETARMQAKSTNRREWEYSRNRTAGEADEFELEDARNL